MFCTGLANGGPFSNWDPIVPFVISPRFECLNKRTHTVHMALMGYFIVFSFVTKPRPNLRISLVGYHCAIEFPCGVLLFYCCKYPTTYGVRVHTHPHTHTVHMALVGYFIVFSFVTKPGQTLEFLLWGTIVPLNFLAGYYCSIVASTPQPTVYAFTHTHTHTLYIWHLWGTSLSSLLWPNPAKP